MRYWKPRPLPAAAHVGLVVVAYERPEPLACLLASLRCQTHDDFEVLVRHDGPCSPDLRRAYESVAGFDTRFTLETSRRRQRCFGHPLRMPGLRRLAHCDYLGTTNDDGYYAPVYMSELLAEMVQKNASMAYCDMVHSHRLWRPLDTELQRGRIDVGCWLAAAEPVLQTPWTDHSFAGDWTYLAQLSQLVRRTAHVKKVLYVHN